MVDYLAHDENLLAKYKKIKRNHIMIFIIGILIGLMYIVMNQPDKILEKLSIKYNITNVSDISDIKVL
jgi:hypothetical protein